MNNLGIVYIALIVMAIGLIYILISSYNRLIALRQQIDRSWANIDVILQQRYNEIPQLIKVIEQFTVYERSIIDDLVQSRQHYGSAQSIKDKIQASKEMSHALGGILAIAEGYPELKSHAQFLQLQERISSLENTIADRRENYNETVTNYNTRILQFPDSIFATKLNYTSFSLYKVDKAETRQPSLNINLPTSRG